MCIFDDEKEKKENEDDNPFIIVPLTDSLHSKKEDNSEKNTLLEKVA